MKRFTSYLPAVTALVVSFILLILPGSDLPGNSFLSRLQIDKLVHVIMFAGLVWLWCRAFFCNGSATCNRFLLTAVLFAGYGIAMEFVQKYYVPGRSFDVYDIAADLAGCGVGVVYSVRIYLKP